MLLNGLLAAAALVAADVTVAPDGAVKTPSEALAKVREMRKSGALESGKAAVVAVRAGRYALAEPLVLTAEDSGIRFIGPDSGKAVFDAGVELPPFKVGANGIWETSVAAGFDFDQLWINGRRAQRARTPDRNYLYMAGEDFSLPKRSFFAEKKDMAVLAALPKDELHRVVVSVWQSWDMGHSFVESVDGETGRITFRNDMKRILFFWDKTRPRYAIENCRAALDAPGEWFLDFANAKLLYLPLPGETPENVRAVAPRADGLVRLDGNAATGRIVRDVEFRNLGFEHVGWKMGAEGAVNNQSAANIRKAAIFAAGAANVTIANCRIAHTGAHGIWLQNGCRDSRVVHSLIEDLGAGGVYFGDVSKDLVHRERNAAFLSLSDSIVRHGGRVFNGAIGVWIGHAHDCEVVHNEIADFFYTGVSLGWTWGYAETINRNNRIDFNHIHHIGQGRLSDMGAVYTLGDNTGSQVCRNWIHDVNGYGYNGSPAWGLYTDEGSHGLLLASNLVERCRDGAVHQHYGSENVYANNIFATFDRFGVWRSRDEDHVTIRVLNNVFWWKNPEAGAYTGSGPDGAVTNMPAAGNVYWCAGGAVRSNAFRNVSWETWRAKGGDVGGAIADPLFADPENGDWSLKADSPARTAGFRPFDWKAAGVLKGDADWVRKAAEVTWEPFEDAPKAERYRRKSFRFGFEAEPLGAVREHWSMLKPLSLSIGKLGALSVVNDARNGKRALCFRDSPDVKLAFQPHVYMRTCVDSGRVTVGFSYRGDAKSQMLFETRDYYVTGAPYATGHAVSVKNGRVSAGGKFVCSLKDGEWADFELCLSAGDDLAKGWTCAVTPVGGKTSRVRLDKAASPRFRNIEWLGFISPGRESSTWYLDDFSSRRSD